jgi:hypothetical protein
MMDALVQILSLVMVILFFSLYLWAPMELCHKAGYSRALGLLVAFTFPIGLIVFVFVDWPVYRELGWRKVAMGDYSERDLDLAQAYAIDLEQRGDWEQAAAVYEELSRKLPDPKEAEFAATSAKRLQDRIGLSRNA